MVFSKTVIFKVLFVLCVSTMLASAYQITKEGVHQSLEHEEERLNDTDVNFDHVFVGLSAAAHEIMEKVSKILECTKKCEAEL